MKASITGSCLLALLLLAQAAWAQPTLLVDTGAGASSGGYPLFGTGSTTCSPQPACSLHFQFLAGQFTLTTGALLDSVQGWMSVGGSMSIAVKIYTDNSGIPGTSLYSQTYPVNSSTTGWLVFSNYSTTLAAGTYWLAFEPQAGSNYQASMPSGVPNPLPLYAYFVDGNRTWATGFSANPALGMRVSGTSTAVPPQFGTFTRVSQVDGITNFDQIFGDLNQVQTSEWFFSTYSGTQAAEGTYVPIALNGTTITDDGPTAGAWSAPNQGYGAARALAFRTFTNGDTAAKTFKVNAVLDGRFLPDPFGLPMGPVLAGGAVHVFDTDQFGAALSASGQAPGQFLLGGYPVQSFTGGANALDPSSIFQQLLGLFPGAVLGDASVFPTDSSNQQQTIPIATDFVVVGPGKMFTVMFDVATSAQSKTLGDQTGSGEANFFNTLKPAANFFTDVNGNPITGIVALGSSPVLPPAAANLSLTPATATNPVGTTHTLTATTTTAGGAPVPNAIVKFTVTGGPNAGVVGGGGTDANGQATFTYTDKGGAGTDSIQASIGAVVSSVVHKTWQAATKCPQPQGFWKNNPNAWPVSSLTLGSQTYSKTELRGILGSPGGADASLILAVQEIAAKLNIANGSDPTPISATIATADTLLSGFSGKLPYKVKPSSAVGQSMTQSGATLQLYNTGQLTPACTP